MRDSRSRFWLCLLTLVFTATLVPAATVSTLPATGFSAGSAMFNAVANPVAVPPLTSAISRAGFTTNYGSQTGDQLVGNGNNNIYFSQLVSGVTGGQIYHYRADILPLIGETMNGNDQAFFMPGAPPPTPAAATAIHPGQATLNATINPNNANNTPAIYWFQHGLTTSYGSVTPASTVPGGTNLLAVSNLITGLPRGVTYHHCAVIERLWPIVWGGYEFQRAARPNHPERVNRRRGARSIFGSPRWN